MILLIIFYLIFYFIYGYYQPSIISKLRILAVLMNFTLSDTLQNGTVFNFWLEYFASVMTMSMHAKFPLLHSVPSSYYKVWLTKTWNSQTETDQLSTLSPAMTRHYWSCFFAILSPSSVQNLEHSMSEDAFSPLLFKGTWLKTRLMSMKLLNSFLNLLKLAASIDSRGTKFQFAICCLRKCFGLSVLSRFNCNEFRWFLVLKTCFS